MLRTLALYGLASWALLGCFNDVKNDPTETPDVLTDSRVENDTSPNGDISPQDTALPDTGPTGPCETQVCTAGETCCVVNETGLCVNTAASSEHCGACANACEPTEVCQDGTCTSACGTEVCSANQSCCDEACVDTGTSNEHCGACGAACVEGELCDGGLCACPADTGACLPHETCCSTGCVNAWTDTAHCGACDNACDEGLICISGSCRRPHPPLSQGEEHACVRAPNGEVYCWGMHDEGQAGSQDALDNVTPPSLPINPLVVANVPLQAQWVATGHDHTCILTLDNALQCWGSNNNLQAGSNRVGDLDFAQRATLDLPAPPEQVSGGRDHTCALVYGEVYCWGNESKQRLGFASDVDVAAPTLVPNIPPMVQISAGDEFTCTLERGGQVWCWGANTFGEMGTEPNALVLPPTPVSGVDNATAISAANEHVCALLEDETVVCWGRTHNAEAGGAPGDPNTGSSVPAGELCTTQPLPISDISGQILPDVVELRVGKEVSCALDSVGAVWCWGNNDDNRLANAGAITDSKQAVRVQGLNGPMEHLAASSGGQAQFTCATRTVDADTLEALCWGLNDVYQLGVSDETNEGPVSHLFPPL